MVSLTRADYSWLAASKVYMGGWQPDDLAVSTADVFDSIVIVRVVPPVNAYSESVCYQVIDNCLWGWNTKHSFPRKPLGSVGQCHYTNLHRTMDDIIARYEDRDWAWNGAEEQDNQKDLAKLRALPIWGRMRCMGLIGNRI